MAKKKEVKGPQEVETVELDGGAKIVKYDDGSFMFFPAPMAISAEDAEAIFGSGSSDDEDEEGEEGVSIEDMRAALIESGIAKKKVKGMSDEDVEEAYAELAGDEEDEDDEEGDEDPDDEEDEEGEEVSAEDLAEADFEDLEDIIDEQELEIDADDYDEEDVEKLRKEVAKALGITLPKAKKGKK